MATEPRGLVDPDWCIIAKLAKNGVIKASLDLAWQNSTADLPV